MESILQSLVVLIAGNGLVFISAWVNEEATYLGEVGGTINEGRCQGQVLSNVVSKRQRLCDAFDSRLLSGESAFKRDVLDRGLSRRDSDPANLVPDSEGEV